MNACIMRNLVALASKGTCGQIDIPQLVLGLLIGIFKSDFPTEKYYMQWKSRQVTVTSVSVLLWLISQYYILNYSGILFVRHKENWFPCFSV